MFWQAPQRRPNRRLRGRKCLPGRRTATAKALRKMVVLENQGSDWANVSGVGEMVSHDVKKQGGLHAAVETSSQRESLLHTMKFLLFINMIEKASCELKRISSSVPSLDGVLAPVWLVTLEYMGPGSAALSTALGLWDRCTHRPGLLMGVVSMFVPLTI